MNFFKLYIGDYQRDTAHLSVTEHGAYLLMLQHYYATEKPLPIGKALHRMLRAQDKAEREAIDSVAAQFWRETVDGLVNDRADVEITKAGAQAETNRAIAQAREAKRKASRASNEQSTNRATNDQPNHNHSQTPDLNTPATAGASAQAASVEVFPIHERWAASPAFATQAKLLGLPVLDPSAMASGLAEFVAYWIARPNEVRTQAEWENALAKSLKHRQVKEAKGLHKGSINAAQGKPPTAAELRVFRSSPQLMDPAIRARCEAFSAAGQSASNHLNVIEMEAHNGFAIGMD
jgi:uncharacterized protein YdaU (DUF1376 family)